jgi:hypothetical protein
MRFGMAALLALALGAGGVAHASPLPVSLPLSAASSLAQAVGATPAAPAASAVALEVGDFFPPWIIDFSFWAAQRLVSIIETYVDVLTEQYKEARQRGDGKHPTPPDPSVATPPVATPGTPSQRLEP